MTLRYLLTGLVIILTLSSVAPAALAADGTELFASGDYAGAIAAYEQELTGDGPAPVLGNIGTCYMALGQPEKASEYYTRAVTADPAYGRGWINLGVVQEKRGRRPAH